tara:strand:- start:155 stop:487 length:333 start_codon:yes stop_codon:yes gene_type:complete
MTVIDTSDIWHEEDNLIWKITDYWRGFPTSVSVTIHEEIDKVERGIVGGQSVRQTLIDGNDYKSELFLIDGWDDYGEPIMGKLIRTDVIKKNRYPVNLRWNKPCQKTGIY